MTETTSLISVNHPFKLGKGSIGKVLPGREVRLASDGEILVRGGGVTTGYWDTAGRQTASDEQGWYRTGDIGALDDAGNLYFKGRKKDVMVTAAGLNIYPEDLEAALRRQPEVKDCVVVGIERRRQCRALRRCDSTGRGTYRGSRGPRQSDARGISADANMDAVAATRFSSHQHAEAAPQPD